MNRSTDLRLQNNSLRVLTPSFFAFGLLVCFLFASYLQRGRFDQLFLFDAPDTPPVPGDFYPGPLGVHTFGDFLQPLWQSRLSPSPFISGYSSYLPASNGMFWLLSWIPYWGAFCVLLSTSLLALLAPFWNVDRGEDLWARTQLLICGVLLTYPVLSALDRGNIQLLTIGLIVLSMSYSKRRQWVWAGICLGLAIGFKAYPALFLILFMKKKMWKSIYVASITSALATIIPLVLFDGGLNQNIRALTKNLGSSQSELSSLALFSNNSLEALALSLQSLGFVSFGSSILVFLPLVVLILFLCLIAACASREIDSIEISLLISAFCTLSIGFSAGYVLMLFLIPAWFIYGGESRLSRRWVLIYSVCIAFLFMPKQVPLRFWAETYRPDTASLASFLNPFIMLAIVCVIITKVSVVQYSILRKKMS
jgi:hypothetical protein